MNAQCNYPANYPPVTRNSTAFGFLHRLLQKHNKPWESHTRTSPHSNLFLNTSHKQKPNTWFTPSRHIALLPTSPLSRRPKSSSPAQIFQSTRLFREQREIQSLLKSRDLNSHTGPLERFQLVQSSPSRFVTNSQSR